MKIMPKLYTVVLAFALTNLTLYPVAGAQTTSARKTKSLTKKSMLSSSTIETATNNNELLSDILDNAQILVEQIQQNQPDKKVSKQCVKQINISEKKLSPDILNALKEYTSTIKEEHKRFCMNHASMKKYDPTTAEQALKDLAHAIKQATQNAAESIISHANQTVQEAIAATEQAITQAQKVINDTEMQLSFNEISRTHAAKIIGQQNYVIKSVKQALTTTIEKAKNSITKSDTQTNYLSALANGAYNAAAHALAPFKAGYGYTDEEKSIAREIIDQLQYEITQEVEQYQSFLEQDQLTFDQQQEAELIHNKIIEDLQNALHQQQLITGDVMSTNRKLFWGTVALAGTLGAGYLAYQHLLPASAEMPSVEEQLTIKQTPVTEQPELNIPLQNNTPLASTSSPTESDYIEQDNSETHEQQQTPQKDVTEVDITTKSSTPDEVRFEESQEITEPENDTETSPADNVTTMIKDTVENAQEEPLAPESSLTESNAASEEQTTNTSAQSTAPIQATIDSQESGSQTAQNTEEKTEESDTNQPITATESKETDATEQETTTESVPTPEEDKEQTETIAAQPEKVEANKEETTENAPATTQQEQTEINKEEDENQSDLEKTANAVKKAQVQTAEMLAQGKKETEKKLAEEAQAREAATAVNTKLSLPELNKKPFPLLNKNQQTTEADAKAAEEKTNQALE